MSGGARLGEGWRIGADAPAPWLVGIVEGAGATLWWPAGDGEPGGLVWDAATASGWIDAVWGGTTAALGEAGAFAGERAGRLQGGVADGPLAGAARRAALAGWREAWWPASRIAGVPALDPRLVTAERAIALAELDGALDDAAAVERALVDHREALRRHGTLAGSAVPLALRVADVADHHGVHLVGAAPEAPIRPRADDYALAASGDRAAAALSSGSTRVDPVAVPQGLVDPAGEVLWNVSLGAGGAVLRVAVPAAPRFGDAPAPPVDLRARVGDTELGLAQRGEEWAGEETVPATVLTRPLAAAELIVPGFAGDPPRGDARAEHPGDALVRIARARLAAPESLAEEAAR